MIQNEYFLYHSITYHPSFQMIPRTVSRLYPFLNYSSSKMGSIFMENCFVSAELLWLLFLPLWILGNKLNWKTISPFDWPLGIQCGGNESVGFFLWEGKKCRALFWSQSTEEWFRGDSQSLKRHNFFVNKAFVQVFGIIRQLKVCSIQRY